MEQNIPSEVSKVSKEIGSLLLPNTNLPIELICLILSKLPIENIERLWVFNNDWFILTKAFCLDFHRSAFLESSLWAFLPQDPSVQHIPLLSYFDQFFDKSWSTSLELEDGVDLEKLIISQAMSDEDLDKLLVGINRDVLVEEEKYLIQQRQASIEISFIDFLKDPPLNWLKIARVYRHIETTLNILLLALFIFNDKTSFNESILLMLDRRLTRRLTGSGLELLVEHTIEPKKLLLSHLINFALDQGPLQKNAQELLYRLTDKDCESLLVSQPSVLVGAIKRQCFPIIDCFGPRALRRVIEENPDDDMLVALLERLGAGQLSKILPSLTLALPSLSIKDNFPVIVNNCSRFMTQLLAELTLEQMCKLIKALSEERLVCFLNSSTFIEFLKIKLNKNWMAREILILLKESRKIWDSLEKTKRVEDFLKNLIITDFVELYLCFYKHPHTSSFINDKIYKECENRLTAVQQIATWNPYDLNVVYWKIFTNRDLDTLTYDDVIKAKQDCVDNIHKALLSKINPLLEQKKEEKKAQELLEKSGNLNVPGKAAAPFPSEKSQPTPILPSKVSNEDPSNDLGPLLSNKTPVAIADAKIPQKSQQVSQQWISKNVNNVSSQKNLPSTIAWCITKGFFVGLLVTGIAILLMMFINFQMDVPLFEIVNELWIAGIAGLFAEIVATACFLSEAKVFESSGAGSTNEKPDGSKLFEIPVTNTPSADPAYKSVPFSTVNKTGNAPEPRVQQFPLPVTPMGSMNSTE